MTLWELDMTLRIMRWDNGEWNALSGIAKLYVNRVTCSSNAGSSQYEDVLL